MFLPSAALVAKEMPILLESSGKQKIKISYKKLNKVIKRMVFKQLFCHSAPLHFTVKTPTAYNGIMKFKQAIQLENKIMESG